VGFQNSSVQIEQKYLVRVLLRPRQSYLVRKGYLSQRIPWNLVGHWPLRLSLKQVPDGSLARANYLVKLNQQLEMRRRRKGGPPSAKRAPSRILSSVFLDGTGLSRWLCRWPSLGESSWPRRS
jgi:hypothetical protein